MKEFVEKIKSIKHIKLIILLIVAVIVLLCVQAYFDKPVDSKVVNMTETEQRLAGMLDEIEGISNTEVYINYENGDSFFGDSGKISGVLVVAKGQNTVTNKLKMLNALQKALNINKDIIEILIL